MTQQSKLDYDLIYFMGDSFTYAVHQLDDLLREINEENRFSGLIGKHYNLQVINNAKPGCSNYHIFKTVYKDVFNLINQKKKFLAITSYAYHTRVDLFHRSYKNYFPLSPKFSFYKDYMLESFDEDYCYELSLYHILAIRTLFDKFKIDYVDAFIDQPLRDHIKSSKFNVNPEKCLTASFNEIIKNDGKFISGGHANVIGNARIANEFIKKIDKLYGTN